MEPSAPKEQAKKKRMNRKALLIPSIILIVLLVVFIYIPSNDGLKKTKVDGVSDAVYEQMVQHYFYTVTFMELFTEREPGDTKIDAQWMHDHELFQEAEDYAEEYDDIISPTEVFPNPLLVEYHKKTESYSETEQQYIEKIIKFLVTMQRVDVEEYQILKKELKEDLNIRDSDNLFK